MADCQ